MVATGAGATLAALDRTPLPRRAVHSLAVLTGLVALALGLMAAGLPGRLLLPAHWASSRTAWTAACRACRARNGPTTGPDLWVRLTTLLGAPAFLTVAALLAFWPARRATPVLRGAGLVTLLRLYGTAVALHDPGAARAPRARAAGLVAAWLWLPRLPRREAIVAGAVVAAVGVLSLPVAAALDRDRAWWNYHAWNWFARRQGDHLRLEPHVRPASLVARGRDAAERQVRPASVLEGRDARRVRRLPLDPRPRARRHELRHPGRLHRPSDPRGAGTTASTTWTGTSACA